MWKLLLVLLLLLILSHLWSFHLWWLLLSNHHWWWWESPTTLLLLPLLLLLHVLRPHDLAIADSGHHIMGPLRSLLDAIDMEVVVQLLLLIARHKASVLIAAELLNHRSSITVLPSC